ncbi:HNH endonuclease, partial [Lactobacillus amylovorus]|uniref:HNH endonuclease n=1 Tax=Lactobacillus amylovorus TaxID=1604 RepID=UPI003F959181
AAERGGKRAQDALALVRRHGQAGDLPCVICGMPIDYSLRHPHKQACTVQHIKPRATHPHLTWEQSNWAPAHADCNTAQGSRIAVGLGLVSPWLS